MVAIANGIILDPKGLKALITFRVANISLHLVLYITDRHIISQINNNDANANAASATRNLEKRNLPDKASSSR